MPAAKKEPAHLKFSNVIIKLSSIIGAVIFLATCVIKTVEYFDIRPILSKEFNAHKIEFEDLKTLVSINEAVDEVSVKNISYIAELVIEIRLKELRSSQSQDKKQWQELCDFSRSVMFLKTPSIEECINYPTELFNRR